MLGEAGVTHKLEHCKFFDEAIDYLGHVIRPGRLYLAKHTANAVENLKHPVT